MPTVILLDSSLSMFRPIPSSDATETHTRFSLACTAINTFLDYLNVHAKLEYVALVTFASNFDVAVPFTREFDMVRNKLPHIEEGDKTSLETALLGVNQLILNEWGSQTPVQTILLTDGCSGVGPIGRNRIVQALPLPPAYPLKIHVLPIAAPHEASLVHAMPLYQKLIDLAANTSTGPVAVPRGLIYCPDQLSAPGITACTLRLAAAQYQQSWLSLRCGALEARVQLFPADAARAAHVVGFLATQHLGTPITVSKHLIIPHAQPGAPRDNYEPKTPTKEGSADATEDMSDPSKVPNFCVLLHGALKEGSADAPEDMSDPSKVPNFCVLLHGALKVEGMCALVQLGLGYGVIAAWCDSARARRSCLLLSVLAAPAPAPWLGPLDRLGPEQGQAESFPLRASRSYSAGGGGGGGGGGWARPHALLADVHKLLRHARKLPEKTHHLYKELNRLRRAAISLGFSELLTAVAGALQRECAALPPAPRAAHDPRAQLQHAAQQLTEPRTALDIKYTLQPLQLHTVESID